MSNKKYLDLTGVGNLINNVFSKFITKTEHAKEIDRLGDNINRVNDKADATQDWCQTIEDDITDHYSTTVQMNNAITQAVSAESNSIKLEVSDTYATKNDFNNIQIDGCLYSNSTRVVSEVTQSTEPTIQKTGDYWIIEG